MAPPMIEKNDYWQKLILALKDDECVLLIGPRAAKYGDKYIYDLLVEHFNKKLQETSDSFNIEENRLPKLIKQFKKCFPSPTETEALEQLEFTLKEFFDRFNPEQISLYDLLADLPFKYIINTTPDDLLKAGLEAHGKHCHFFDFHFRNHEYNAKMNEKAVDLDEQVSMEKPLVYNLLGHYERPNSLVLTEKDQLHFIEAIIQRENTNYASSNILYFVIKKPFNSLKKTYVFLGFDFNDWHLRMFLHLLGRGHDHSPDNFSSQDGHFINNDIKSFYDDNFNLLFVGKEPTTFLKELKDKLNAPLSYAASPEAALNIMLLHDLEDDALFKEIEQHLRILNRTDRPVNIWNQKQITGHIQETLQQQAESTDIFVPLLTTNFLANVAFFETVLDIAQKKHDRDEAKITVLMLKPCLAESFPMLYQLPTFYPTPKGTALNQKRNRDAAIVDFVRELERIITRMQQRRN